MSFDLEKSKAICEAAKINRKEEIEYINYAAKFFPLALTEIEAKDREIERLREALEKVAEMSHAPSRALASAALGGKE